MIDPFNVTNYTRTRYELEEYWLFCLSVAGKKATMIAGKIQEFLSGANVGETPFDYVRRLSGEGELGPRLAEVKMGKYGLLVKAYGASANDQSLDLSLVSVADLEALPGVGPKTARFFVMHSRADARVAVIDTHVLKYLRARGHKVPKGFPSPKDYPRLEAIMISETDASGMAPADFDLAIWSHYASNGRDPLPYVPDAQTRQAA